MTEYTTGQTYGNFTLLQKQAMPEINSDVYLFRHNKLGCKAFAIKNTDPNKTFCLSFMTVPEDSTGVAHILEHSVLMGSNKYPVYDVFGEINKGGLMTFLNAMTGSDTTWYPFATRNLKEYFNIMDVYCDVTFNPLLKEATFEQEGWHVHLEDVEEKLEFSGVVLNEMKGAYADPIRSLFQQTFKGLLPGSTYAHESGGDPARIPDLTYQQFVEFHHDHYHPSNCTIFFYGDAPLSDELKFVDEKFLTAFPESVAKAALMQGTPISKPVFIDDVYPVQPESELAQKTFLAVSSIIGTAADRKLNTAFQIIANILYNSDASPLKNRILEAGLCKDFGGLFLSNSAYTTIMMTYLIGSDPEKRDTFLELYRDTLKDMVTGHLDRELVLSELNKYEFSVREEMNKPQRGLDLIGKALPAMKYDIDPFSALGVEELFAEIRKDAIDNGYFEQLIEHHLLDNPATAVVTLRPDPEKLQNNAQREQERLLAIEEKLTDQDRHDLVKRTRELVSLQSTPNSNESLRLLPRLTVQDLDKTPHFHEVSEGTCCGRQVLINDLHTNGISYIDFGFDCSGLSADALALLDIFGTIVTEIGTSTKDFIQFTKEVNLYTGGLSHSFQTYMQPGERESVRPVLWFHVKTLSQNLGKSLGLISEIFIDAALNNRQRIKEIVQREYAWAEHATQSEGYQLALTRVFSHLSRAGKFNEYISGAYAYMRLKELALNYDDQEEAFLTTLLTIANTLFLRQGLLMSITADANDTQRFLDQVPEVVQSLPDTPVIALDPDFESLAPNQAFCTSAEVVYNVQGFNLFKDISRYNGSFEVLKTWISRDYLWNTVRQQGGAYGCFVQFNHLTGNFGIVSYRDPQVDKTYAAYGALGRMVGDLDIDPDMLKQLIIGTYGNLTPHQGPASRGATARNEFLSGITAEFKQRRINDVINTSTDELRSYAPLFSGVDQRSFRSTLGNSDKISASGIIFDKTTAL